MIAFAVAVSDPGTFERAAVPGLRRAAEPDSPIAELTADGSLHACYDEALEHFAGVEGLEALVLLHQDAEILDPAFCDRVRAELADPDVAVCGVVGARGVSSLAWWEGELVGGVSETRAGEPAEVRGAPGPADADAVDGLLMVLSPWAVRELRFAHEGADGFDGYDIDLCFQARAAGRRVRVLDVPVHHHHRRPAAWRPDPGWLGANERFRARWGGGEPGAAAGGRRAAAGAHAADEAAAGYFDHVRPELLERVPTSARTVLDVGCGKGALGAAIAARQGAHVIGIEVVPEAAAVARTRLAEVHELDLDTIEELPVAPGTLDCAVLGDVLEHLHDPARVLRLVREHLAPDGVVVASVPNIGHWSVVAPLLVDDAFPYAKAGLLDHTHVHFFTRRELLAMLDEVGLRVQALGASVQPAPEEVAPLVAAAASFGVDADVVRDRLGVYQYLVTAAAA